MISRRFFLAGTSVAALASALPSTIYTASSPFEAAVDLIKDKMHESLQRVGNGTLPQSEQAVFAYWRSVTDMRTAIHVQLARAYKNRQMQETKEIFGSILEPSGRMRIVPQMILADSFAILPDQCDRMLFDAYALFAPPHLR